MSNNEKVADLLIPGPEYLLSRINATNGTNYTMDQVNETDPVKKLIIGAPRASAEVPYNTDIEVTFPPEEVAGEVGDPVTGELHYERYDLGRLFAGRSIVLRDKGYQSHRDLINALLEEVRLKFDEEDLPVNAVIPNGDFPKSVVIRADPLSLRFTGQFSITLEAPTEADTAFITDPVVAPAKAVSNKASRVSTDRALGGRELLIGTGNPTGQLFVATNGELEVASGSRLYKSTELIPAIGDTYKLNVGGVGDWNIVYSIALLDTRNGLHITDLYDCGLKVTAPGGGVLHFKLVRRYGRLHFVDAANELFIDDPATFNEDQTVYQDIQRVTFYKNKLGTLTLNGAGAPLGNYEVELRAARKDGAFDDVVVGYTVEVTGIAA